MDVKTPSKSMEIGVWNMLHCDFCDLVFTEAQGINAAAKCGGDYITGPVCISCDTDQYLSDVE